MNESKAQNNVRTIHNLTLRQEATLRYEGVALMVLADDPMEERPFRICDIQNLTTKEAAALAYGLVTALSELPSYPPHEHNEVDAVREWLRHVAVVDAIPF